MKNRKIVLGHLKAARGITGLVLVFLLVFLLGGMILARHSLIPLFASRMEGAAGILSQFGGVYLPTLVILWILGLLAILLSDLLMALFFSYLMPYLGFRGVAQINASENATFRGSSALGSPFLRVVAFSDAELTSFARETVIFRESRHPWGGWLTSLHFWWAGFLANVATLIPLLEYIQGTRDFVSIIPLVSGLYIFFFLLLITGLRWGEVLADLAVFKKYGEKAWEGISEAIMNYYETDDPEDLPLGARFLHTGQRELTLRYGDLWGPLFSGELVLPLSALIAGFAGTFILLSFTAEVSVEVVLASFLVLWVIVVVVLYALGLLFDMGIEIIARGSALTNKGAFNLSLFLTSLLVLFGIGGLFLEEHFSFYVAPLVAVILSFFIAWFSMRTWWRGLSVSVGVAGGLVLLVYLTLEFESLVIWVMSNYVI